MSKAIPFEKSMSELEDLVKQLERGDTSLEECLKQYERGMALARKCHETLSHAEQKIEVIRVKNLERDDVFNE